MRIPPAAAQQIGQHFAAARTHEAAARQLADASSALYVASRQASAGDSASAIVDAARAVDLLAGLAGPLATPVSTAADSALAAASDAVALLAGDDAAAARVRLDAAAAWSRTGSDAATDHAAGERATADAITRQYL